MLCNLKFVFWKVFIVVGMSIVAARATVFFVCFLMLKQLLLLPIVIKNNLHILLYNLRAEFNKASTLNAFFCRGVFM